MKTIFDAGDLNQDGICRSIVGKWISLAKGGTEVKTKLDLGSVDAMKAIWTAAPDNDAIDTAHGLVTLARTTNTNTPIGLTWIAQQLTKGSGYFLFAVRGKTLNVANGRYDNSGHAMATRKGIYKNGSAQPLQYLDPNLGLVEFATTLEFYDFLPGYIRTTYPDLLSREAEVKKF